LIGATAIFEVLRYAITIHAVEVRLKEKLTCGPHTSVREGREVAGVFWTIRKYTGLRVGPKTSKTYKMARFKEEKNCNGTIQNT